MSISKISSVVNEINNIKTQTSSFSHTIGKVDKSKQLENKILDNLNGVANVSVSNDAKKAPSFATMLKSAIDNVNALQSETVRLRTAYEKGDPDVDIVEVMVAAQKSSVAFDATMQVRNKLVGAYQEVMRMAI